MKKLIILPLLLLLTVIGWTQSKVMDKPVDTDLTKDDWFLIIHNGTKNKRLSGDTLLHTIGDTADVIRGELADTAQQLRSEIAGGASGWSRSGDITYLTNNTDSTGLGTSSPTEKLDIVGNARVRFNALIADSVKWYGTEGWIWTDEYDVMYLGDASGTYDLSTLGGAGVTSGSGITIDGSDNIDLGGTMTENADINTSSYIFNVHNSSGGTANMLYLSGQNAYVKGNAAVITGHNNLLLNSDSVYLKYNYSDNSFKFGDSRTGSNILGIEYYADYSSTIKANNRSIPDVGTVAEIINDLAIDTVENHAFSSLDADTLYMDTDKDSYLYSPSDDFIGLYTGGDITVSFESGNTYLRTDLLRSADYVNIGNTVTHFNRGYFDTIYMDKIDNDSYIYSAADDDDIRIKTNNTLRLQISSVLYSTHFYPISTNSYNFGNASYRWDDCYLNDIYIDADNDSRITTLADDVVTVMPAGTSTIITTYANSKGATDILDTLVITGDEILCFGSDCGSYEDFTAGGSGTPGGNDYNIQLNRDGSFAGTDSLKWDENILLLPNTGIKYEYGSNDRWIYASSTGKIYISFGEYVNYIFDTLSVYSSGASGFKINSQYGQANKGNVMYTSLVSDNDSTGLGFSGEGCFLASDENKVVVVEGDSLTFEQLAPVEKSILTIETTGKVDTTHYGDIFNKTPSFIFCTDSVPESPNPDTVRALVFTAAAAGLELIDMQVSSENNGDRIIAVKVIRMRAGVKNNMTSTSATLGAEYTVSDEVIDTSYDDIQAGDIIMLEITQSAGSTRHKGIYIGLTFQ